MSRKNTPEFVETKVLSIHKGIVSIDLSTFIGMREKARFIDVEYGEWWTEVRNVVNCNSGHPLRKKDTIKNKAMFGKEELDAVLISLFGEVVTIDFSTYRGMNCHATFIDKDFGPWRTRPANVIHNLNMHPKRGRLNTKKTCLSRYGVEGPAAHPEIREKIRQTNLNRYGVEHPSQDPDYALRTAKKLKHTTTRIHWETGEELVCQASYETKVVDHLNLHKIRFLWQPQTFQSPMKTKAGANIKYRPDLFLIQDNKWVEIKGWMRPSAALKWEWFKGQFPTAELWDKPKLKEMGIL